MEPVPSSSPESEPTALWRVWERTFAESPDALAVADAKSGSAWTRQQLFLAAITFSKEAPPAARGAVVAFAQGNHPLWLAVFLGLQRLGAVALPLDPALPRAQRPQAAAASGAGWLIQENGSSWQQLARDEPASVKQSDEHGFCLVKTTSGTTGEPRPLLFTSENMLADGRQIISSMEIRPDDRNLGVIPLGHSYGLGNLVMPLLLQGTPIVCSTEILPHALAEQIEEFQATVLPGVPVVLHALGESAVTGSRAALRTLRRVISAGAPLRPEVAARFLESTGLHVQNFYGSSETGGICFDRTGEATLTGRSIGQPLDGVSVRLEDDQRVVVRSPAVIAPGEWKVSDLGRWNEAGELVLTGRAAALVNIGGKKVAPTEIERALRAVEGVTDVWVGVQTREISGGHAEDFLLAAVETGRSREEILGALAAVLPAWQIPRRLWVMGQLPRNSRGKLERAELEGLGRA